MKDVSQWTDAEIANEMAAMETDVASMRLHSKFAYLVVAEYERRIGIDRAAEQVAEKNRRAAQYLSKLQSA